MNSTIPSVLHSAVSSRWAQYLALWGVSFAILARYFAYGANVEVIDLIYTALFHISLVAAVVANSFLLIPALLARQKYLRYALGLLGLTAAAVLLNQLTFRYLADALFPGYYFISYYHWTDLTQFVLIYLGLTTLLQLSRSWFREAEMQRHLAQMRKEQTESELKVLRNQINPHFLFNSLNHIYALTVRKAPAAGDAILKLSELLRYTIRNAEETSVPLTDEIRHIRKYVDLYRGRVHHAERIQLHVAVPPNDYRVPPLLLLVFIENCFKHGSIRQPGEFIRIDLLLEESTLSLTTQNTISGQRVLPVESTGLGLDNVQRRLGLIYPGAHTLTMDERDDSFHLNLRIQL